MIKGGIVWSHTHITGDLVDTLVRVYVRRLDKFLGWVTCYPRVNITESNLSPILMACRVCDEFTILKLARVLYSTSDTIHGDQQSLKQILILALHSAPTF
jgi:hypothetical protein